MRKIIALLSTVIAVMLMSIPLSGTAEAANVAVIPIDINVEKVERAGDFNSYYWDMIIERFKYPEYELIDDEKISAAVPEGSLRSFDEASLAAVADKVSAEIVIAMRISEVKEIPKSALREPAVECCMEGELAILNKITGKYYNKKINYDEQIEAVWTLRNDWQQKAFADHLRRGINRALEFKGKK